MATATYPGVYIQEVSSGVRTIALASTSTAAFVGQAERGPTDRAVRIFNFTEFQNIFGGFMSNSYLAHSVFQFFTNGGSIAYIVRVAGAGALSANIVVNDRASTAENSITISAANPGIWGNSLEVVISDGTVDPANEFNVSVYQNGSVAPIESFDNLSMLESRSNFADTATANSNYIRITVNTTSPTLTTNDARGTSRGAEAPTVPLPPAEAQLRININNDGFQDIDLNDGVGATPGQAADLTTAANIATALQYVVQEVLTPIRATTPATTFDNFTAVVDTGGELLLTSGEPGATSAVVIERATNAAADATTYLQLGVLEQGIESLGVAITRPFANTAATPRYLIGLHDASIAAVASVQLGTDGAAIINDTPYSSALNLLDTVNDVSLISIPGVSSPSLFGDTINYCENRSLSDCFVIGEMPLDVDTVGEAQSFVSSVSPKNSYGALYMPWLLMNDPTGVSSEPIAVPPSGFVAGLYAKTDNRRGVWKAPAGVSVGIAGATGLSVELTDVQQGLLNPTPYHVNVIRQFAAAGRVLWGARTITSDTEWNYIPVRRMAILLRVSIYRGIQWAVFEPNDEPLWAQLRLNISSFMMTLYRRGAFQGATPDDAFFVKVDSETTTQADIDAGIVNIQIGFAPLKPAEFVMVQLSQKAGQAA